jgi:Gas vesicle protein K
MIMTRLTPNRLATDDETAADDLVRLVLALVETLRQLIERQAIRRVEGGHLADDEVERLGLALLRLEQRMDELKDHFGLQDEDLSLRLDLGDLADIAMQESESLY